MVTGRRGEPATRVRGCGEEEEHDAVLSGSRKEAEMERTFDKWLLVGIGLIVALLLGDAWLDYYNTRELHRDAAQVARTHAAIEALQDVDSTMKDAQAGHRGYLVTGDPSYLEPWHDAASEIQEKVER